MLFWLEPFLGVCHRCTAASFLAHLKCVHSLKKLGIGWIWVLCSVYSQIVILSFSLMGFSEHSLFTVLYWLKRTYVTVLLPPFVDLFLCTKHSNKPFTRCLLKSYSKPWGGRCYYNSSHFTDEEMKSEKWKFLTRVTHSSYWWCCVDSNPGCLNPRGMLNCQKLQTVPCNVYELWKLRYSIIILFSSAWLQYRNIVVCEG